jgi:hypothetical protein
MRQPDGAPELLLSEVRYAVEAVVSYVEQSGRRLDEAVDVVCDELGIPSDADRRVIRNGAAKRQLREAERRTG